MLDQKPALVTATYRVAKVTPGASSISSTGPKQIEPDVWRCNVNLAHARMRGRTDDHDSIRRIVAIVHPTGHVDPDDVTIIHTTPEV